MKKLLTILAFLVAIPVAVGQVNGPIPYNNQGLGGTPSVIKAAAGALEWAACYNPVGTQAWIQIFDVKGTVTLGATTPTFSIPAASGLTNLLPGAANFFKGIQIAASTTATGGTAPSSNLTCNAGFK